MKKDDMSIKMKKYYADIIPPNYLLNGMYVAMLNYKEEKIDNKYIIVNTDTTYYDISADIKSVKVTCYDFIENKIVVFDGNACDFIKADEYIVNNDDFCYKYDFTLFSVYKKLRVGDEVVFINPENVDSIENRQNPIFKIVKKQKKEKDYGRFNLLDDTGYVLHNVPSMILKESDKELSPNHKFNNNRVMNKENAEEIEEIENKYDESKEEALKILLDKEKKDEENTTFSIHSIKHSKPKTPSKLKFSIDIDYSDNAPIEILFKDDNKISYSRKALMCDVPLDKKIEISNTIKDVFKKIFYNEDKNCQKD